MSKKYFAGIDVGTSYIKAVIIDEKNEIAGFSTERTSADLKKSIKNTFEVAISAANISRNEIKHITATGFGRNNVSFADNIKTEISSHAKGAYHHFPKKITIIDIGGQDTKIIKVDKDGKTINFKMNRKCAAGTGSFLEEIAYKLDIPRNEMNKTASKSSKETALSSFCTVFASTEILTRIKEGENTEDMIKSAFESVVKRVIEMDTLEGTIVITGGVVAHNDIILKILTKFVKNKILMPPKPQLSGAFGAALFAKEA
ncbi:MAG: ATPase [Thermoplasmatales archaeon]|jgi:predicted CoA-substrate-specific enzyme activase|nr:ATPase [Thermoplasmatales archaeon]